MTDNTDIATDDISKQSWKQLLKDPRIWAIIILTVTMSASVTSFVEKTTGLKFNPSADSMSNECVYRALHDGELSDAERVVSARVCVPEQE